jgi:HK97 family phage prohead protease
MENRKKEQPNSVEHRYISEPIEVRAIEGSEAFTIRGYALKFGVTYDMGWFTEEIARTALDSADMADVRILLNHDSNIILGRTASGTARLGIDDVGMWYEADLPNSPNGDNVREALRRGDITQSSWGFTLRYTADGTGDKWERVNGRDHRTITNVLKVYDASPVTFPANPDTSVAKRSLESLENTEITEPTEQQEEYYLFDIMQQI